MKDIKYLLWDWNGTLLDDAPLGLHILNTMLARRRIPTITMENYRDIFTFPIKSYYEKAGFDLVNESYDYLADEYWVMYEEGVKTAPLYEAALPILAAARDRGISNLILSAAEQSHLDRVVADRGLAEYFEAVIGLPDGLGVSKVEAAAAYIREQGMDKRDLLFIGDTLHDKAAADAIGCPCILCAWGHQSKGRLEAGGCPVAADSTELARLILG